jgi:lauroyl/myristoyl acyltransferase
VRGLEHCRAAQAAGRPIVVLTGHFAALEIGGVMLSRELPMAAFIKPAKNRVVDWFMTRGRRRFRAAANVFLREQGLRPVVRALKAGSALYYLPDEDFGPERSVFLPFLGTEAATITALPRLAKLAGAAVIPCFTRRLSARAGYEIVLEPPLDNFPSGDDLADARRMNQVLERAVRAAPEQYMWTLKLFRTRPGGAPSPYG